MTKGRCKKKKKSLSGSANLLNFAPGAKKKLYKMIAQCVDIKSVKAPSCYSKAKHN